MLKAIPPGIDVDALLRGEEDLLAQLEAIHKIKRFLGLVEEDNQPTLPTLGARSRSKKKSGQRTWLDDLAAILKAAGQPMHWSDLYAAVRERRPNVNAKQPAATIRSYVSRAIDRGDNRVVLIGAGKFGLSEWGGEKAPDGAAPGVDSVGHLKLRGMRPTSKKDYMVAAVIQAGRPMRVAEILGILEGHGITIDIPSARSYVSAAAANEQLVKLDKGLYAPPGYKPDVRSPAQGDENAETPQP